MNKWVRFHIHVIWMSNHKALIDNNMFFVSKSGHKTWLYIDVKCLIFVFMVPIFHCKCLFNLRFRWTIYNYCFKQYTSCLKSTGKTKWNTKIQRNIFFYETDVHYQWSSAFVMSIVSTSFKKCFSCSMQDKYALIGSGVLIRSFYLQL